MRSPSRFLFLVCTLFVSGVLLTALPKPQVRATADYAQRTGQPCAVCHLNPEGGGALGATGASFARGGYVWPPSAVVAVAPSTPLLRLVKAVVGYVHLLMAVFWFGTIMYIHVMVRPQQLTTGIPRAERRLGWTAIVTMAVTGIVLTAFRYRETGAVFTGTWGRVFAIKLVQYGLMVLVAAIATVVLDRRMRQRQATPPAAAPAGTGQEAITADSLPGFDGRDGRKAVVAYEGKLYDVSASPKWREGAHMRKHQAGQDLSEAIKGAPHGPDLLERFPVVGALQSSPQAAEAMGPRWTPQRIFVVMAYVNLVLVCGILLCVAWWKWGFSLRQVAPPAAGVSVSAQSAQCIACHTENAFLRTQMEEWRGSVMASAGTGCYECHQASSSDPDAMTHNGFTISALVTPNDCGRCHVRETAQFAVSRHSQGGDILDSLDNVLGERVEGVAAAVLGCQQCHGSVVKLDENRVPTAATWPNTGIGRINPDGSRGSCSTCHTRHLFSVAVGREPSACGNCHLGPDHPQKEIYDESKHGVAFVANRDRMQLDQRPWVLGEDYTAAPTCATCHMSAVPGLEVNHDVGQRISWTLRPAVSTKLENWEERRDRMTQVCRNCHSPPFFTQFFVQYDDVVALYNTKFAVPAGEIMSRLREAGKLTATEFDENIEWTYFYLWHHEGRRARHGAAMMGPDYVQWHGFFEVADRFYNEFIVEAEELLPGVTEPFLADEAHQWRLEVQ